MSERRRTLPLWMANKEKEKRLDKRSKQKSNRAAFYCMNEKELVEAAASYLFDVPCEDAVLLADQKALDTQRRMEENPSTVKMTTKPVMMEESSDYGSAQETTYVSESDLDITEMGMVPYTKSPSHEGPVEDNDSVMSVCMKAGKIEQNAAGPDDALQLVREIFFT